METRFECKSLIKKLNNLANMDVKGSMTKATELVQATAVNLAPVDTGMLRESIHMDVKETDKEVVGTVYTNCEYAPYVEFGTGIMGDGSYPYDASELGFQLVYSDKPFWRYKDKNGNWHTSKGQVAQPFMYPAIAQNKTAIKLLLDNQVKTILKGGK